MENDWWLLILTNHSQCTTSTSLMKNCSMVKKIMIIPIPVWKKVYYIFLFLKVNQCKFKQKETILKLGNPLKSKSKFTKSKIDWMLYPEPTGGLLTLGQIFSPSIILKSPPIKMCSENTVPVWIHYKFDIPPKCSNCIPYFAIEKNFIRLYFRFSNESFNCIILYDVFSKCSTIIWLDCFKQLP